jgi:hypothetical protein
VRLTVNLERDLYAVARSLAREQDCSISAAVNILIRRGLEPPAAPDARRAGTRRAGGDAHLLPVVEGERPFTSEHVYEIEDRHG